MERLNAENAAATNQAERSCDVARVADEEAGTAGPETAQPREAAAEATPKTEVNDEVRRDALEIKRLFDEADAATSAANQVAVPKRYQAGVRVNARIDKEGKYAKGVVKKMAEIAKVSVDLLYSSARVARTWSQREIEELVAAQEIPWSVFAEVSRAKEPSHRAKLLKAWSKEKLAVHGLRQRLAKLEGRPASSAEIKDGDGEESESGGEAKGGKAPRKTPPEVSAKSVQDNLLDAGRCLAAAFKALLEAGKARPEDLDAVLAKLESHGEHFVATVRGLREGRAPEPMPDEEKPGEEASARRPARGGLKLLAENRSAARRASTKKGKKPAKPAKATRSSSKGSRKVKA